VDLAFDRIINEIYKVVSQSAVAEGEDLAAATKDQPQVEPAKKAGVKLEETDKGTTGKKKKRGCCK
jgi:hypothetical protein